MSGGVEQRRQHVAAHGGDCAAARVRGAIDGGDHSPATIADRRCDRAQALLELLVDDRPAPRPDPVELGAQVLCARHGVRGEPREVHALEVGVQLIGGQPGEQNPAHRGGVSGEPRADVDRDGHDARHRHAGDVHHVLVVEDRDRRRLADRGDQPLEVRLGDLGQRDAREVGVAQLEHPRAEREAAVVCMHVAEIREREQKAPRRGPCQPGLGCHLGERELGPLGAEGADYPQPAVERLDVVRGTPFGFSHDGPAGQIARNAVSSSPCKRKSIASPSSVARPEGPARVVEPGQQRIGRVGLLLVGEVDAGHEPVEQAAGEDRDSRCGAWATPPEPGIRPGLSVRTRHRPCSSVRERPKPQNRPGSLARSRSVRHRPVAGPVERPAGDPIAPGSSAPTTSRAVKPGRASDEVRADRLGGVGRAPHRRAPRTASRPGPRSTRSYSNAERPLRDRALDRSGRPSARARPGRGPS